MPKSEPHFVPESDRAQGEPDVGGLWRNEAEERAAELTAPEIWVEFRKQFPEYWNQRAWEILRSEGSVTIIRDFMPDPTKADRAPLRRHLDQELRDGLWVCFGFSEQREERVRIASPWRGGLAFDDLGGMTTAVGARYSDVLLYRVETPGTQGTAPGARRPKRGPGSNKKEPAAKRGSGRPKIENPVELAVAQKLVAEGKSENAAADAAALSKYSGKGRDDDDARRKLARRLRDSLRELRKPDDGS